MLAAFTARPIIELKQRDKSKVESILAFGDMRTANLDVGGLLTTLPKATASLLASVQAPYASIA